MPHLSSLGRTRARGCAAALLLLTLAAAVGAQTDERERFVHGYDHYEPWHLPADTGRAEAAALQARWDALAAEIRVGVGAAGFAGTYRQHGAMRTGYLRWAPGGGYVYLYVYEDYLVIDFSYGRAEATPSGLLLTDERGLRRTNEAGYPPELGRRLMTARWKDSAYLVPERRARDFGNYVAGLAEYNDFNGPCCEFAPFLSKWQGEGDEGGAAPPDGPPVVPQEYAGLMRRPVEAEITWVGRTRRVKEYGLDGEFYSSMLSDVTLTPVRLAVGRAPGMRPGLLFRMLGAPDGQYLKVTRVGRRHSDAVVIRNTDEQGREDCFVPGTVDHVECPPVVVGLRVTTSPR